MSASYQVEGFVTLKIRVDDVYSCSQSTTHDEMSRIVADELTYKVGSAELISYELKQTRVG